MLWVLKRTIPMRRFFWAPKTYVKIDGLENIYNFTLKFVLSKPVKTTPKILMNDIFSSSINIDVNLAILFKTDHQRGVNLTKSVH